MASAIISNFIINNINSDEKKYLAEQQKRNISKKIKNLTNKSNTLKNTLHNNKSNAMFKSVIAKFNVDLKKINDNIKKYESMYNRRKITTPKISRRNSASGYTKRNNSRRNNNSNINSNSNSNNNRNSRRNNNNNSNNSKLYEFNINTDYKVVFTNKPPNFLSFIDRLKKLMQYGSLTIKDIPTDEDYDSLHKNIQNISIEYKNIIALQDFDLIYPGDILTFPPSKLYLAGHSEIALGSFSIPEENAMYIYAIHPMRGMNKKNQIKGMYGELARYFKLNEMENIKTVFIFHYIGKNADLIRATSCILSKLFLSHEKLDYSGFCSVIFKKCIYSSKTKTQTQIIEKINEIKKLLEKLITTENIQVVCSGSTIVIYQISFIIHDMYDELFEALPFNAFNCSPSNIHSELIKLHKYWEAKPCPKLNIDKTKLSDGRISSLFKKVKV